MQLLIPLTQNVKKIKGAAHKNGDVDGKCKRALNKRNKMVKWSNIKYFKSKMGTFTKHEISSGSIDRKITCILYLGKLFI